MTNKDDKKRSWKPGWRDEKTKDSVLFDEDDVLVKIDLAKRCDWHSADSFCRKCLPRLESAAAGARVCIDPTAAASVEEFSDPTGYPELLALANRISKQAFKVRLRVPQKVSAEKPIYTSKRPEPIVGKVMLVDWVSQSEVCDCRYVRGVSLRLKDGASSEYAQAFWDAKLTFEIDGERLFDKIPVREFLGKKEVKLPSPSKKNCLFTACVVREEQEIRDKDFVGYMAPDGTSFKAWLEEVPGGGGLIHVVISWGVPIYSTRDGGDGDVVGVGGGEDRACNS